MFFFGAYNFKNHRPDHRKLEPIHRGHVITKTLVIGILTQYKTQKNPNPASCDRDLDLSRGFEDSTSIGHHMWREMQQKVWQLFEVSVIQSIMGSKNQIHIIYIYIYYDRNRFD